MPAYNGEKYIGQAIESILKQSYPDWELLIVEDCSGDNTLDVIRSYKDERIRVICNKVNKGIAESTNIAINLSKGKYLALLDDDDVAEKDRLEVQVDFMEKNPCIDILGGRTTFIDGEGQIIDYSGQPRNNPNYIKAVLLFKCLDFMNSTAMMRKDFVTNNNLIYLNGCYGMQDYRFYIESSKVGRISSVNHFLLRHRLHENNETNLNFKEHERERKEKYAEFQRYSLRKSGFRLNQKEMGIINHSLPEIDKNRETAEEFMELFYVFRIIIEQACEMGVDYCEELKHVCKSIILEKLKKFDLFEKQMICLKEMEKNR